MGLDKAHYHGWQGPLHSPWISCLSIVRVALVQVFRRKLYWLVIGLGLLHFVFYWAIIYGVTQVQLPPEAREMLLERFGVSVNSTAGEDNAYCKFMEGQSILVVILLAFSGNLLVGSDFQLNTLPFYLSRRVDRRHYIVGKLLAVSALVSLLTVIPALALFAEYGSFTPNTDYWLENWRVPLSVLGYGLVMCVVLSILLVSLSAWLKRAAPIAVTWCTLFLLLRAMADQWRDEDRYWVLIDLWRDIRAVGRLSFDSLSDSADRHIALCALGLLVVLCSVALAALIHKVRAVEVVE